ncbi:MAG TPA: flagellar motor protein MotB [Azospirillaceae bacterium]|nr:flagellar motor protein MotB [Azospirillaceae bacterium]
MRINRTGMVTPPWAAAPESPAGIRSACAIKAKDSGKSPWLITFVDLLCLILAFFVMSYSMTAPEKERFSEVARAMSARLDPPKEQGRPTPAVLMGGVPDEPAMSLDYLASLLRRQMGLVPELAGLPAPDRRDDRLVLSVPAERLFVVDQSAMTEVGWRAMGRLSEVFARIDNRIEVASVTDPDPVDAAAFRSRWELALARGQKVAEALNGGGYRGEVVVRASADAAWVDRPAAPRRVEIVVLETREERR